MKEHKFTQHIGLKIIALLFSFLLWLFVVNIDNPKMSKVFDDVQVTMENDEIVLNNGSTYSRECAGIYPGNSSRTAFYIGKHQKFRYYRKSRFPGDGQQYRIDPDQSNDRRI